MVLWIALLRGVCVGFIGAIPVGPVNAAVLETAIRSSFRRALAVGVGGAFVDLVYSQIALAGLTAFIARDPSVRHALLGVGGVTLIVYGLATAGAARRPERAPSCGRPVEARALLGAAATGALITVANPAALVSWVLVAGTLLADLSALEGALAGAGIFAGTTLWFAAIAGLAARGRVRLGARAVWVTRVVAVLLVAYGAFLVGKTSVAVWAFATPAR